MAAGVAAVVAAVMTIPFLQRHDMYYIGDNPESFVPLWHHFGEQLRAGHWPTSDGPGRVVRRELRGRGHVRVVEPGPTARLRPGLPVRRPCCGRCPRAGPVPRPAGHRRLPALPGVRGGPLGLRRDRGRRARYRFYGLLRSGRLADGPDGLHLGHVVLVGGPPARARAPVAGDAVPLRCPGDDDREPVRGAGNRGDPGRSRHGAARPAGLRKARPPRRGRPVRGDDGRPGLPSAGEHPPGHRPGHDRDAAERLLPRSPPAGHRRLQRAPPTCRRSSTGTARCSSWCRRPTSCGSPPRSSRGCAGARCGVPTGRSPASPSSPSSSARCRSARRTCGCSGGRSA